MLAYEKGNKMRVGVERKKRGAGLDRQFCHLFSSVKMKP